MAALLETQQAMRASLLDERVTAAFGLVRDDGIPAEARLQIYRNTMIATLTKALALSYPAVERLVGAAFFEAVAREYLETSPPHTGYLDLYGDGFGDFLRGFQPAALLAYLPDVAALEWAVSQALHAPDRPALEASDLAALDPASLDALRLRPHESVRLVRVNTAAAEIWRAVLEGDDEALAGIAISPGERRLLVWRSSDGVKVLELEPDIANFVVRLFAGETLGAAFAGAGDVAADFALLLARGCLAKPA